MEKIIITAEDGENIELYVVEQTRVNGKNYLLVTETEEDDAEAYILKDVSESVDTDAMYEFVDDEEELNALAGVFSQLIDDDTELI